MKTQHLACFAVSFHLVACGGISTTPTVTPTPTPSPRAVVHVLIDPNPVLAVPSGDPDYPWSFAVNLQVSDSGGVAFLVTSMQTTVTATSTGETWLSISDTHLWAPKSLHSVR